MIFLCTDGWFGDVSSHNHQMKSALAVPETFAGNICQRPLSFISYWNQQHEKGRLAYILSPSQEGALAMSTDTNGHGAAKQQRKKPNRCKSKQKDSNGAVHRNVWALVNSHKVKREPESFVKVRSLFEKKWFRMTEPPGADGVTFFFCCCFDDCTGVYLPFLWRRSSSLGKWYKTGVNLRIHLCYQL